ncbi:Uncharacterized protein dnm_005050 [Desulfonema magnum]|uniref:Uncharacterized protein n=2 Tax=Desulfonema magnum TaxID=45655 RepID=A0A975GL70_9BACT|nr:Uncharacterized protein dnm_005050 [Desulfonema magnum]
MPSLRDSEIRRISLLLQICRPYGTRKHGAYHCYKDAVPTGLGNTGHVTATNMPSLRDFSNTLLRISSKYAVPVGLFEPSLTDLEFQVSSFEFQVSNFKFQVSSFEFRVSSFEFQVSSFKFQVSNFKFQVSSFEFRVSSFEFPVSSFKFQVSSFKFQVS